MAPSTSATPPPLNCIFYRWQRTERNADYLSWLASTDGLDFYGRQSSGNTGGWKQETLDLANVYTLGSLLGQPRVWIAFLMESNDANTEAGPFLDDIVIRKYIGAVDQSPRSRVPKSAAGSNLRPTTVRRPYSK